MVRLCGIGFAAAAILLAGCASGSRPAGPTLGRANIRNGLALSAVRYQSDSGTCSRGALQLLTRDAVGALVKDWDTLRDDCEGPKKQALPGYGHYPSQAIRERKSGSAHVLVRLEADGRIESVHAVCASDAAFGTAAEETTSRIRYAPMTCAGQPTRVAFFLPLDYDI
jgi:TonB family protein